MNSLKKLNIPIVALSLLIVSFLVIHVVQSAQPTNFISGVSREFGWEIDVVGTSGTFTIDDKTWDIEFLQETGGLNGFSRTLSYFGREEDNFIRVDIFIDSIGSQFIIFPFDYKNFETPLIFDRFDGEYIIGDLDANPTLFQNYLPLGLIPGYDGPAFSIDSDVTSTTEVRGTVSYQGTEIVIFPIIEVPVSPTWHEIWAVGVDPASCTGYYMQFFGSPNGWLFNLSTGEVFQVEFGGTELSGDVVEVNRNFNLEDSCN